MNAYIPSFNWIERYTRATTSLYDQLRPHLLKCPLSDQDFLPLSELDEKITVASVRAELFWETLVLQRSLPDKIFQHAKKVFVILVLMGEPRATSYLFQEGLTDEHLPLSQEGENYKTLVSVHNGKTFKLFAAWGNDAKNEEFVRKQWLVQAPVLDTAGKHIILDPKCALPFREIIEKARGGIGTVYKGTIHRAHQQGFKAGGAELQIAIKEFRVEEAFVKENENLQQIQRLQDQHPIKHLIKHVATCERGQLYYIMFPWADGGNLREFWTRGDSRQRTPELILWSLRQMLGLVDALKVLHGANIRHGDLKPENILHFKEASDLYDKGEGILVIADVGVSKVHREATSIRNMSTSTRATTPAYEGPEAQYQQGTARSRKYDMWSIGCMFLEFTIWLLYNLEGINNFRKSRISKDDPKTADASFYLRTPGGKTVIHPTVSEAMNAIRKDPRCKGGTALEDLVKLIAEDLLLIEVSSRSQASELYDKLEKIVQHANIYPEYFLNRVNSPPDKPFPFSPAGS